MILTAVACTRGPNEARHNCSRMVGEWMVYCQSRHRWNQWYDEIDASDRDSFDQSDSEVNFLIQGKFPRMSGLDIQDIRIQMTSFVYQIAQIVGT